MSAQVRSAVQAVVAIMLAWAAAGVPAVGQTDDEAYRRAHAPNVGIEVAQRIFPVGEKAEITASLYNTKKATFRAYKVSLEELAPNAYAVYEADHRKEGSLPYRLKRLDLSRRRPAARWTLTVKEIDEDYWASREIKVPKLRPGVYVITMTGGGVEKRSWIAISDRVLVSKRSPDVVFGWLVNAKTGQPIAGSWV
ncbi:unnamed protein product, partial [marine sediment metagenome]